MYERVVPAFVAAACLLMAAPQDVSFSQSAASVGAYDFVEITVRVSPPASGNPFTDAVVKGEFRESGSTQAVALDGFCNSGDGSLFRIRFMPAKPGEYVYKVVHAEGGLEKSYEGT